MMTKAGIDAVVILTVSAGTICIQSVCCTVRCGVQGVSMLMHLLCND